MSTETTTAAAAFAQALEELAAFENDPEGTTLLRVTVTDPATGEHFQLPLEPSQLGWVTELVRGELDTFRNAHTDGTGYCGHCQGTGFSGGPGGTAAAAEPPADDRSRP